MGRRPIEMRRLAHVKEVQEIDWLELAKGETPEHEISYLERKQNDSSSQWVIIEEADVTEAIAHFVALVMTAIPEARVDLSQDELAKMLRGATLKKKGLAVEIYEFAQLLWSV